MGTISSTPFERSSGLINIGSRGSQLALWQAHWIQARLEKLGEQCRIGADLVLRSNIGQHRI